MDNWDITDGDAFTLFNVNTYQFVGQPVRDWMPTLYSYGTVLPMVADIHQVQPLTIHKVNTESRPRLTTNSIFKLSLLTNSENTAYIQSPPYGAAAIQQDPPLRVDVVQNANGDQHLQWQFRIAYVPQKERNDTTFHYGMPLFIVKNDGRRYLRVDDSNKWLAVWRTPIEDQEMDSWILFPMNAIYNCLSPKIQRCHYLQGVDVLHANFRCKYAEEGSNEIQCLDDEGHPVHRSLETCRNQCRQIRFQCNSLFECVPQMTPEGEKWQDYDQCILGCINPLLQKKAKRLQLQEAQRVKSNNPVVRVAIGQWLLFVLALSAIVGVMIWIVHSYAAH